MGRPYYRYRRSLYPFAYLYVNDDDEEGSQGEAPDSNESQNEDGNVPRPDFVLIEPCAYFVDRTNTTTAYCETSRLGARGTIKVTFCAARPPLVSYFCVHATAFGYTEFAVKPHIIATEADGSLVLLRLAIGKIGLAIDKFGFARDKRGFAIDKLHYLVYDARGPSLRHLPQPGRYHRAFNGHSFARAAAGADRRSMTAMTTSSPHSSVVRTADSWGLLYSACTALAPTPGASNQCWRRKSKPTATSHPRQSPSEDVEAYPRTTSHPRRSPSEEIEARWHGWISAIISSSATCSTNAPSFVVVPLPPQSVHLASRLGNPRSVWDVAFIDGFIKVH
ncbi:hypothetical protein ACQ4PT_003715 [Festuca glaucescens]